MITIIEFKLFIESYKRDTNNININTLDTYLKNFKFPNLFYQCNFNKIKGDIFEYITKYYYLYNKYEVYLFKDIPIYLRELLSIGNIDNGVDLVYKDENDWIGVQCKWRTIITKCIHKDLIAGFISELKKTKLNSGCVVTNVNNINRYHAKSSIKWITRILLEPIINLNFIDYILGHEQNIKHNNVETPITNLRYYQNDAITNLMTSTESNKKCIMACGTGKTIVMMNYIKQKNSDKILILLPSLQLISQFYKKIVANLPKRQILCICSQMDKISLTCGEEINDKRADDILNEFLALDSTCYTTDIKIINNKLKLKKMIVLCTYQSSGLLKDNNFDLGIFDEAHKTVNNKVFGFALDNANCKITERIYFTATPRYYKGLDEKCVSMDNEEIYGKICYEYSFKKAIEEKHILDFQVISYAVPEQMENIVTEKYIKKDNIKIRSEILISAIMLAQHIKTNKNCTKILTYHNTVIGAGEFKRILNYIFDKLNVCADVYVLSGQTSMSIRSKIFNEFESANISIICSARVLNEGVDIPCVNAIMFVDPRNSTIDVTQCVGRGMRLHQNQTTCDVIIPIHYNQLDGCHNYSEIIRILMAMSEIDDKLIEYYVGKKENNKIIVKNMIVTDICESDDVKYNLDDVLNGLTVEICKSNRLRFGYNMELLFGFCDENGRTPVQGEEYKNVKVGHWFVDRRSQITSSDDEMYKKLATNKYVKINLDKILKAREMGFDYNIELFFKFCEEHKRTPKQKEECENVKLGSWFQDQKKKINSSENSLYKKFSVNMYAKTNIDKYLMNSISNKNKIKLSKEEWSNLLFKFCDENKKMPSDSDVYNGYNIGAWLRNKKQYMNDINDDLYKKLSTHVLVKENLDNYLKNFENKKGKQKVTYDTYKILLFEYSDENKSAPQYDVIYKGEKIGRWLNYQKYKIKNYEDEMYKILSVNIYVKENIDNYLDPDKQFNEWCELLFEYCNAEQKIPTYTMIYKNKKIGMWYGEQKKRLCSVDSKIYVKLSTNPYLKRNMNNCLRCHKK